MSLAGRLTAFFLTALALVLAGFSVTLYLLAHTYLSRQVDDRLEAALHTLTAAAEVKSDGVEWEPEERRLSLGRDPAEDQVRWTVHDGQGRLLDHSANLNNDPWGKIPILPSWRLRQLRLDPEPRSAKDDQPTKREEEPKHASLLLTVGVSLQPLQAMLRTLGVALVGVSVVLWLLAAVLGRWLCRRALAPLTRMAAAVRTMNAADLHIPLPAPGTSDELEELSRAFNGLLARLHEAFERQRRFTGDASHQLRTPLTALLGQVEVALHRERSAEEYRQTLELVRRQTDHLRRIVESLLFLARADADAALPDLETVDLKSWLEHYLQGWSDNPRRADIRLECCSPGPVEARVHAPLLGQLLDNLLDNACKYSEPGTMIILRLQREPCGVTLSVEDGGCGIATEDLPHVFEPFYRSDRSRRLGRVGVGLGLAVAQRIAAALGGKIRAESEPGRGSRLVLRLPASLTAQPPRSPS